MIRKFVILPYLVFFTLFNSYMIFFFDLELDSKGHITYVAVYSGF